MRRRICVFGLLLLTFAIATDVTFAKPRRVDGKGVFYALEVTTPGAEEPEFLVLDPGRDAWQCPMTDGRGNTPIRFGRGLSFTFLKDSRYSGHCGFGYFEAEPLEGRSFEDAAKEYEASLTAMWDGINITLNRILNVKPVKRLKVAGCKMPGVRLLQDITIRANGTRRNAQTVLFEMNGHLVSLTFRGKSDYLTSMLKGLERGRSKIWRKAQEVHVVDVQGRPGQNTCFVIRLPAGYRSPLAAPKPEDPAAVACWRLPADEDRRARQLTWRRLSLDPTLSAEEALGAQFAHWREGGADVTEPRPTKIDGRAALEADFRLPRTADSETGKAGWMVAWKSPHAVYALVLECIDPQEGSRAALCAEGREVLDDVQTWEAKPVD